MRSRGGIWDFIGRSAFWATMTGAYQALGTAFQNLYSADADSVYFLLCYQVYL